MNKEFTDIELIEQYCNDQLEGDQLTAFEQRLQKDATLLQEVELFQDMMKGIELHGDEQLENSIAVTHQELVDSNFFKVEELEAAAAHKPRAFSINRRILAIAASLAILVSAGLFLLSNTSRPSNQAILADYGGKIASKNTQVLIEDTKSFGMVATDRGKRDTLIQALENYNEGEYEVAKLLLDGYVTRYSDDVNAQYYLGHSYFELGDYQEALVHLQPLSVKKDFIEQESAEWYTALSYLLMETEGSDIEAKNIMKKIYEDNASSHQEDAANILKWLK